MREEESIELEGRWTGGEPISAMARARKYKDGDAAGGGEEGRNLLETFSGKNLHGTAFGTSTGGLF